LFTNGYAFDEFSPDVITSAIDCAIDAGTSVFFDPGPRGRSLLQGNLDEQRALEHALRLSDVLLLTADEVSSPI
jgi:sugar/nucleoside kinase (ribokinase family)